MGKGALRIGLALDVIGCSSRTRRTQLSEDAEDCVSKGKVVKYALDANTHDVRSREKKKPPPDLTGGGKCAGAA